MVLIVLPESLNSYNSDSGFVTRGLSFDYVIYLRVLFDGAGANVAEPFEQRTVVEF